MIQEKIKRLLPAHLRKRLPRKVAVVITSEKESRSLNRRYRKKNSPLTFSLQGFLRAERSKEKVGGKPANALSFRYSSDYGEILVCPSVIRREAKKQGNTYKYQMTWMIVHGMIHLAGVHHEKSRKLAKRVELLEDLILKKLASKS